MSNPAKPMTGLTFGRLTVLGRVENWRQERADGTVRQLAQWLCRCDCGNAHIARGDCLRDGRTSSCGCLALEHTLSIKRRPRWGDKVVEEHPLYQTWGGMKQRCHNAGDARYADYGGRGIYVCDRWRGDFLTFAADMGERPAWATGGIDRIDNDGPYSPENCRWATNQQQRLNQRPRPPRTDRTVHAITANGSEIVRYDRNGKWYIEHGTAPREFLKLADAVRLATEDGATATLGRLGGRMFDAAVRKARESGVLRDAA